MARNCLSLQKKFSMRCLALYISLSRVRGTLRLLLEGITGDLPAARKRLDQALVGIKSFVCQQSIGLHLGQQRVGTLQIVGLAWCQKEGEWIAQGIDQGMDFGAQSAFAAPDRLVFAVFFWAPALC